MFRSRSAQLLAFMIAVWSGRAIAQGTPEKPAGAIAPGPPLAAEVDRVLAEITGVYEWLHAHPELSGKETETAKRMAQELRVIGLEVQEGIGGTGVVGLLRGKARGPVVLYRADMDALPITEKTGLSYASKSPGVMHACGHDIHMATALGTLRLLAARKDQWSGTILFVGQPAEETGQGASDVLADPKFKLILRQVGTPRVALAIHDTHEQPAGTVGIKPGPVTSNVDALDITVIGKGGHGGAPQDTIDPIVIGAEIVMSLQTIVSRKLPPGEMGLITVGMFQGGTKHNIIPSEVKLLLSVRSYTSEIRTLLLDEIARVARGVAAAHNAPKPPTITQRPNYTPAATNDPAWAKRLDELFRKTLDDARVQSFEPSLAGEDFGRFSTELGIPGVMWRVGGVNKANFDAAKRKGNGKVSGLPTLHSDTWAPDPAPTLRTGILTMTAALLHALDASQGPGSR